MTRDKGRLDLKQDVRQALIPILNNEPLDSDVDFILAAVLPHFELACKRGVMGERSRAGYRKIKEKSE
ncbi:hypothetical protein ACGF5F_29795 [Streptomyces sp. NPDC047821]|uniref:hypothetical protein n=1 Tax=Streptomyces sp. NPDC047821 TaxID=3365488 RepID=UPI00371A6F91